MNSTDITLRNRSKRRKQLAFAYALVAPSFLLVLLIVGYPIFNVIVDSFKIPKTDPQQWGFDHYVYLFTNKASVNNLIFTLQIVIVTVLLATVIAFGLALYLRFFDTRVSKSIGILYLLPRFIPGLVAVNAMIIVIRNSGFINRLSLALFNYDFKPEIMNTGTALVMMNLWFNIPFATMIISSALSSIPDSMIESARDVGAKKIHILFTMIIPLVMKDIMIAVTFIFMGNVGSFTTPYLMGPTAPKMLSPHLFSMFQNMHYERSAALSVVMFLLCSVSAIVYIYTNMKEQEWEHGG